MDNLVRISDRKILGHYVEKNQRSRLPNDLLLVPRLALVVALPPIICAAYGGIIPSAILGSFIGLGLLIGFARYRRGPSSLVRCVDWVPVSQGPLDKDSLKKAA